MPRNTVTATWRAKVQDHRLAFAIVAGVVGTHIASITGYWYQIIKLPTMDFNTLNGLLLLPNGTPTAQFLVGAVAHYATGICFAIIFVFLVHPLLPWANTAVGNMAKAMVFGVGLAVFSALIWFPGNFPSLDPGFLSFNLGWKTPVAILLWHVIYAVHLGAIYNPVAQAEFVPAPAGKAQS